MPLPFCKMLLSVAAVLALAMPRPAISSGEACNHKLRFGDAISGPGVTLGDSVEFWNPLETSRECFQLYLRGVPVALVWAALQTDGALFVLLCRKHEWPGEAPDGPQYGTFDLAPSRVTLSTSERVRVVPVQLPGLSTLASPSYCNSRVAYWQMGPNERVHATVVELSTGRIAADVPLDLQHPASDFSSHFPNPEWESRNTVRFSPDGHASTLVSVSESIE